MSFQIKSVSYFYTTVNDLPGAAYALLTQLSDLGINLHAFTSVPVGPEHTQLSLFPDDAAKLRAEAKKAGIKLEGPHNAILVHGDDELGALTSIHEKLYEAKINVYASNGVTDGKGSYGYIIYIRPESFKAALKALNV